MIIFKNHAYQTTRGSPNENYLVGMDCEQPKWVVPDGSELARKIATTFYWKPVEDENGSLIDITPVEPPVTADEQIDDLKSRLTSIDMQTVRPLRAIMAGTATEEDREKLAELEAQAVALRKQIAQKAGIQNDL